MTSDPLSVRSDPLSVKIRRLVYPDLPQVIAIERRVFPTPWSLAMFVLERSKQSGICLAAVLDAKRGEAFLAAYTRGEHGAELVAPRALKPDQIASALAQIDGTKPIAVGDGAIRFAVELRDAGALIAPADSQLHLLRASCICELAFQQGAGEPLEEVLPSYGRRPDAEIAIEEASR